MIKINKLDNRIIGFIQKYCFEILFFIITVISLKVRVDFIKFESQDYQNCLLDWFNQIKEGGGLLALKQEIGNYNIPYLFILATLTYIPINPLISIKIVSIIFDYIMAFTSMIITYKLFKKNKDKNLFALLVYSIVILLPTVVLNSSAWAQCDSIYTFFIIASLYYFYKDCPKRGFLMLGLGFALKLQTIFILPFIICLYFTKKNFSLLYFAIAAAVFWLSGIVAYLNGADLLCTLDAYIHVTGETYWIYNNYPSFWYIFNNSEAFKTLATLTALALCGTGLYAVITGNKKTNTPECFLNTAAWFVWTEIMFLPFMHERYGYITDILLLCLCFIKPKYIKYAALSIALSTLAYGTAILSTPEQPQLFPTNMSVFAAAAYIFMWIYFSYDIIKSDKTISPGQ